MNSYDLIRDFVFNPNKIFDNTLKEDKDNENIRKDNLDKANNLDNQVKANNGIIADADIQPSTLNEVHNQELENRQQAVKIEQENTNKFSVM